MDTGRVNLDVTLKTLDVWGASDTALVLFPTYYVPSLGESLYCSVAMTPTVTDGSTPVEETEGVYCEVSGDWVLKVWGPSTVVLAKD